MDRLGRFLKKLFILFGRKRFARELVEEMGFHRKQSESLLGPQRLGRIH
jgi:hypothetical protein